MRDVLRDHGQFCEEKVGDKKSQVKWDQNVVCFFVGDRKSMIDGF